MAPFSSLSSSLSSLSSLSSPVSSVSAPLAMSRRGAPRRVAAALAAAGLLCAAPVSAIGLRQAYEAALRNDPSYRVNFYENEIGKENRVLGRAGLLPNISASYGANRNRADIDGIDGLGRKTLSHPRYISRSATVQLRQPIVALDALARYRQGVAQSAQSAAQFEANTGEVALRVVGAYVDALFADDQLALAVAQRATYQEQQQVNTRLFEKGEGTKTDMLETQARLDLAEAQVVEAQDNLRAQREVLEGVVGTDIGTLDRLTPQFGFDTIKVGTFDEWKASALVNNHDLQAARFGVESARQEIGKSRAGHAPRLDFVAVYNKADSETLNTYTQDTLNRSIGIQLNVPLYAGGAVNATSRQAVANLERARADLDVKTNKVLVELHKAYSLVLSSVARVGALVRAVESGKLLITATEQSIKGGVRINLDLLNAQQQLSASERDLAQARYSYLLGVLRLRAAAGTLDGGDLRDVAAYFR